MGNSDGSNSVPVNDLLAYRINRRDPVTGRLDRRRALGTPQLLARGITNNAMHELGHYIAGLEDATGKENWTNYMTVMGPLGNERTMRSLREWASGPQSYSPAQREIIVEQLKKGEYLGWVMKFE